MSGLSKYEELEEKHASLSYKEYQKNTDILLGCKEAECHREHREV